MRTHTHRLLAIVFLCFGLIANAQSEAEKTLLKNASKQFESQEFLEALPSYSQLLSISPDNKDYNFKYGVCLLASDEDVDRALQHLKYVCADGGFEDTRAFYYLGKAYHLNYQFADALRSYKAFKDKADSKTANAFREVDRLITMAENGKELMSDIKDIKVIDKTESTAGDFFRNYDMGVMGGSVIKVPEELLSSSDKKKGHSPVMFFPDGGGEIIFSSYGSDTHLELYSVERTSDGGFSKPEKLLGVVNSPFDEDYPFLHSDGRTLYFSSKGHNSMGGYDVFKSKRDLSTGIFDTPVNLDFAISSPDDDIFYMVDQEKRIANFASDRSSESGRLHVYKVAVSNAAVEMAIIQGKLVNNTGGNAIAQIRVLDANTDEEVGVYLTDEEGNYLIDLPGTGKYKFFVEAEESNVLHTGLVDVPSFGKIKAFKQEMVLSEESAQEKLVIRNQFDQEADVDIMALIQEVVKQRAELDINFDGEPEPEVEEIEEVAQLSESEIVSRAGFAEDVSIESVKAMGMQQSAVIASRIEAETIERDKAYARALEWTEQSEGLMQEAEQLYKASQSATSSNEKEELLLLTVVKRAEAERATHEAAIALVLAEEIDEVVKEKGEVLKRLEERNTNIESSLESNDQQMLIAELDKVKSYEDKAEVQADALDAINQRSIESTREARKVISRVEEIRTSKDDVAGAIRTKETQLEKSKKQKDKNILEAELNSLRAESEDLDRQLEMATTRLVTTQNDADDSEGAVKLLEQMRVGQMEELVALRPIPLQAGGLDETQVRIGNIRSKGESIEVSKEEVARIMQTRPELLASLSSSQKQLLEGSSEIELTSQVDRDPEESRDGGTIDEPIITDPVVDDVSAEATEPLDEQTTETVAEELPRIESEEPDFADDEIGEVFREEATEFTPDIVDYSDLSSSELIARIQSDYQSALDDIENSDMNEMEKARANIDLNGAATQVLDQKIIDLKYSSDFAENEVKQANVQAMHNVVNGLEAEMLIIAAHTETPLNPTYNEQIEPEEVVDSSINEPAIVNEDSLTDDISESTSEIMPGVEDDVEANVPVEDVAAVTEDVPIDLTMESQDISDDPSAEIPSADTEEVDNSLLAFQLDRSETLERLEKEIAAINDDSEKTNLVKAASRIKTRAAFVESIRNDVAKGIFMHDSKKEALEILIDEQHRLTRTDVQIWQVETGVRLSPGEIVLAENDESYIARRTLLETESDAKGIEELNFNSATDLIVDVEFLSDLGVDVVRAEDRISLEEIVIASDEIVVDKPYVTLYSELAPVAENEDWVEDLISSKPTRQFVIQIREEMSILPVYGSSDGDKVKRHIALNNDLADPLSEELHWKEEELAFAAKRNPLPPEVGDLMGEAFVLRSRADVIRAKAQVSSDQTINAEMFTKATLLDLEALDKLEEAQQLEKHLSKGKDRAKFEYKEAIVINSGEIMAATDDFAEKPTIIEEELLGSLGVELDGESATASDIPNVEDIGANSNSVVEEVSNEAGLEEDAPLELVDDSQETPQVGVDNTAVVSSEGVVDDSQYQRASIGASEAIKTYPQVTAELTEVDILPILSFEDEISLMDEQDVELEYPGNWDETSASPEQLSALEGNGIAIDKHARYRTELEETVAQYEEERKKRTVRLAEVIDQMNETGATDELRSEAERLATEIQIIDSYIAKANENIEVTKVELTRLEEEQQAIIREVDDSVTFEETTTVPEENFEIIPESAPDTVADIVPEGDSDLSLEEVAPAEISAPDYYAFVMPDVLTSDLFRISAPDETRTRSIPIDGRMPSGTVYQVQVGAFRNPIPEAHFSEFDPITGTRLDNGITRYKVGLFQDETTAIEARDQIRSMGYSDAFVVKYIDGSRDGIISTPAVADVTSNNDGSTALTDSQDVDSSSTTNVTSSGSPSATATVDAGSVPENEARTSRPLSSYDSDNTAYYEEAINAAPATQVERIEGLFYTVQVGVYSKPVTLASIFSISPLNSDLTSNGYIRYTSGIFDDPVVADQWKEKIRERGVADAFVTAYYNGNRITIQRASEILSSQGQGVLVEIQELDLLDSDRQGQAIWEMVSTSELFSNEVADQIDFKIRMGPYYERIPDKDVKVILDFEDNVDYSQRSDGAIIYTPKGRMTYDQAQEWRERFLGLGITNANIIALQEGKEIPVKQALDFLLK